MRIKINNAYKYLFNFCYTSPPDNFGTFELLWILRKPI